MDKKLVKAINEQIVKEFYSAYLYLSMAAYLESISLKGTAQWMKVQAKEETTHGMKFFEFLNDRGERVTLDTIEKPPIDFSSIRDVFEKTLKHEQIVTASINNLYDIAKKVGDTMAEVLLHWFIAEQVEEEKNDMEILGQLDYIGDKLAAILMLDHQLGKRGEEKE